MTGNSPMSALRLSLEPPLAETVLVCPQRRNAMSAAMWRELANHRTESESHSEIDAVILEWVGVLFFRSGADISKFDAVFADLESARGYLAAIELALTGLSRLDCPMPAKLPGSADGGGLVIALARDPRFADDCTQRAVLPTKLREVVWSRRDATLGRDYWFGCRKGTFVLWQFD